MIALAIVGALTLLTGLVGAGVAGVAWYRARSSAEQTAQVQSAFYTVPDSVPAEPGTVIKSEPLGYAVPGGEGFRFIYTSIDSLGKPVAVSARIFLPSTPAPAGGRKIMAWAHGTVGLGLSCAPSRATSLPTTGWLEPALQRGWVVVATDYAGLGLPGTPTYLIGEQEARDVVNSVRAARLFPASKAGTDWVVFGASQGGHSSLWTAALAEKIAPELNLVGVAAAVPAAELPAIMNAQWSTLVGWVIGPEALVSWEAAYPDRDFRSVLSPDGVSQVDALNSACVLESTLTSAVLNKVKGAFFSANPLTSSAWKTTVEEQSPPKPPQGLPMLLEQGMSDKVVLPGSNALLQEKWCAAGVNMESLWLPTVSHQDTSVVGGVAFVDWATERFAGSPAPSTCSFGLPAPVTPLPQG